MLFSVIPEWPRRRAVLLLACAVFLIATAKLLTHLATGISASLGDPDDAMRLVLVRDLLAGRGWFDQHLVRIQPPWQATPCRSIVSVDPLAGASFGGSGRAERGGRIAADCSGAAAIELGMMLALVAVVIVSVVTFLGGNPSR